MPSGGEGVKAWRDAPPTMFSRGMEESNGEVWDPRYAVHTQAACIVQATESCPMTKEARDYAVS